jgi:hypothetical protein
MRSLSITSGLVLFLAAPALQAQPASSQLYFMVGVSFASGGASGSLTYKLDGMQGAECTALAAASANYRLTGGFAALLDAPASGRPWLSGVVPRLATLHGQAALALHGTELNLGAPPVITIGGQAAPLLTRTNDMLTTTLPIQPSPGWKPVVVDNPLGTSTLPEGIGVLPLLEFPAAPARNVPSKIDLRGRQGDLFAFAASLARIPPIPLPPLHHGLELDPATLIVLPPFTITDPGGVFTLAVPANPGPFVLYVQAAVVTTDPGYAPASFTNVVSY